MVLLLTEWQGSIGGPLSSKAMHPNAISYE